MCGFFITNNPLVNSSHESIIESKLRFRGPDYSSGFVYHKNWIAYHSRLSIIGLESNANQPIISHKGSLLVFNGEILNYKELGYKYFSREYTSDTLLLCDLLDKDNIDLDELDGFYAFVYIDAQGVLTHAVRDKFGVKPLFYHESEGYITFSSEPICLTSIFECKVRPEAIDEYKVTRAPIFSGSYYSSVNTVLPGHCYINGKYFDVLDYLHQEYDEVKLSDIEGAIYNGVQTRIVSDAPVGLLLSKGVDSNLINSLGEFDKKYSIGFENDADISYLLSKNEPGLDVVICTDKRYREAFEYLLELRGEPMSVPNEVLLYLVAKKAASDGVKVLLSGEGADEFFAGYDRIFMWASGEELFSIDKFLELYCYTLPEKDGLLYNKFKKLFNEVSHLSCFEKVRWFFIKYHMPVLFRRLDFSLMAAGVEGREPIANMHTFVKAVRISAEDLMINGLGKKVLRDILSKYQGRDFAYEKKVGFPVDLKKVFHEDSEMNSYDIWFKNNLKVFSK
ncbi:TPA: asparagine synthase [Citrobacter koseri]|uniref:asparagine synthetase B family protein n=1 Tax=Citrobacter koseri TaxID=545 RepID=UPI002AB437C1|nr:asparagine synthase [Citrobacter koseri]HCR9768068.1 asparagine synthase [Citrobacter koseri]HEM7946952.1 asparagine synthase [Citrobacter koseri]